MLKIVQKPLKPVQGNQKFSIAGSADPNLAGKHIVLDIDDRLKLTGPPVTADGNWQMGLAFQDPGTHQVVINLGSERVNTHIEVMGDPEAACVTVPNYPLELVSPAKPHLAIAPPPAVSPSVSPLPPTMPPTTPPTVPPAPPRAARPGLSLEQLVREAHDQGFSDVHIGVGKVPYFRNRGEMSRTPYPPVDEATFFHWLREILPEADVQMFIETLDFDGAAQYSFARVRINVFTTLKGPAMVLRLIPLHIASLDELNLPEVFKDICQAARGLVLVTGPTGSGKSTTLAALINEINETMPKHIISIEDPIEFVHTDQQAVISQREVGMHTQEFNRALRAALREDPDVILVGEIRDRETMDIALKASQTGHLVMGTLHTNSAVKTIERILNFYEPDQQDVMRIQLAESLVGVVAQALVRTTDGDRAPIHEIMLNTDTIKDYMLRGEVEEIEALIPKSRDYYGMCSMNQSLFELWEAGRITEEVALEQSPQPGEMAIMLRGGTI